MTETQFAFSGIAETLKMGQCHWNWYEQFKLDGGFNSLEKNHFVLDGKKKRRKKSQETPQQTLLPQIAEQPGGQTNMDYDKDTNGFSVSK